MSTEFKPSMNTESVTAETLIDEAKAALACGNVEQARAMAERGFRSFPESDGLRRISEALSKPRLLQRGIPVREGVALNQQWLRNHAEQYRGQWVAVSSGQLLGAAPTLSELREVVVINPDMLVTKIA
jgi:hypothetical protein